MRHRTSEHALASLHRIAPAFRWGGVLGICAIVAGALFDGVHEVARSVEHHWAALFFLYGAGRGFVVGLVVGVGVAVLVPIICFATFFIRRRFFCPPET